jgi:hypothetical protein
MTTVHLKVPNRLLKALLAFCSALGITQAEAVTPISSKTKAQTVTDDEDAIFAKIVESIDLNRPPLTAAQVKARLRGKSDAEIEMLEDAVLLRMMQASDITDKVDTAQFMEKLRLKVSSATQ